MAASTITVYLSRGKNTVLVAGGLTSLHRYGGVPAMLAKYLAEQGLSRAAFAKAIAVSEEAVRRYLSGERIPTRRIMQRIVAATKGKVTANDFFAPPPRRTGKWRAA